MHTNALLLAALSLALTAASPLTSVPRSEAASFQQKTASACAAGWPWFLGPRYVADCSGPEPSYNPTSGPNAVNQTCRALTDPNNPAENPSFAAVDVTIACGGFNVTLFTTANCSDPGVSTAVLERCVPAPSGRSFVAFTAFATS